VTKMFHLSSPNNKENAMQISSYIHPRKVQYRNKKKPGVKFNDRGGNHQFFVDSTSKTNDLSPGLQNLNTSLAFKTNGRDKFKMQNEVPQIYQDLENQNELEWNENICDTDEKDDQNIVLKEKTNIIKLDGQDTKRKCVRKLNQGTQNFDVNSYPNKENQGNDHQPKLNKIFNSKGLANKKEELILKSNSSAPKSNFKKVQKFADPQMHNGSEMCSDQQNVLLPGSKTHNLKYNSKQSTSKEKTNMNFKIPVGLPMIKTNENKSKPKIRSQNMLKKQTEATENKTEKYFKKPINISKTINSRHMSNKKKTDKNNQHKITRNITPLPKADNNQEELRIAKSKLQVNAGINPIKTINSHNKGKNMNNTLKDKNNIDTFITRKSNNNTWKQKSENVNLNSESQYSIETVTSKNTDSQELNQLTDKNLSQENSHYHMTQKPLTDSKQINTIHNNGKENENKCQNSQKINKQIRMGQSDTLYISRKDQIKNKLSIRSRKKLFEEDRIELVNKEAENNDKEIAGSVYSTLDKENKHSHRVNLEEKNKIAKKRKLFCNSACKKKRYEDVMSSSDFEESDYNEDNIDNLAVSYKNKDKEKVPITYENEKYHNLQKSKKNVSREKLYTASHCNTDRYQNARTDQENDLLDKTLDENEKISKSSMPLSTPEVTDNDSNQLPAHSPIDYIFLDNFSSSEESISETQKMTKMLIDDLFE
ncbi:hypothetical protein L9F63_016186, partial [Diploptera punctata]